jgi:hypothetical protein
VVWEGRGREAPPYPDQKLIAVYLADGSASAGAPIKLKIDQKLTQDATGKGFSTGRLRRWRSVSHRLVHG